jgi:hypothetical protein
MGRAVRTHPDTFGEGAERLIESVGVSRESRQRLEQDRTGQATIPQRIQHRHQPRNRFGRIH